MMAWGAFLLGLAGGAALAIATHLIERGLM